MQAVLVRCTARWPKRLRDRAAAHQLAAGLDVTVVPAPGARTGADHEAFMIDPPVRRSPVFEMMQEMVPESTSCWPAKPST
jgi:hypothetical protein